MLLLDTCTLLWLVNNRAELSPTAVRAIDGTRHVFISAASAFEIGTKHRRGKLPLAAPPQLWWTTAVERLQLVELSITAEVALASTALPTELLLEGRTTEHWDPGDRFIVATAATHGLTVVTPDLKIAAYPNTAVLW
ncbi:MAG TPA: type II toxin-antitoxin system VapC family toxin [Kofleriaceae bacterium]|nr:type II toxin-antitoxin system VapC family toxin [Kofleriaceae bacterium]